MQYRTIVSGWDGSDEAARALARAAAMATAFGARLVCADVMPLPLVATAIAPVDPIFVPLPEVELSPDREERRRRLAELLDGLGVGAEIVPIEGNTADAVLEIASERAADLVVIGSPEPAFLDRLFGFDLGGAVERRAHCDVLIVR